MMKILCFSFFSLGLSLISLENINASSVNSYQYYSNSFGNMSSNSYKKGKILKKKEKKNKKISSKKNTSQNTSSHKKNEKKQKKSRKAYCRDACEGSSNLSIREACEYKCQYPNEPVLVRMKSSGGDDGFSFLSEFTNV